MNNPICCVCKQQIPDEADKKNIFKDDMEIKSNFNETEGRKSSLNKIKLHYGIELITGNKVCESAKLTSDICNQCSKKLEDFVNFRSQLLSSFGTINFKQNSINNDKTVFFDAETSDCPKLANSQLIEEDLMINVDEDSTSLDITTFRNEEEINDSTNWNRLQNDEKNNNHVDSDSSNDNIDIQVCDDIPNKVVNNDIESEIDVCSGEDDEVLEIENERSKITVKEDKCSSDSEIEVCDYEPTGKRVKHFSVFSQALTFES